MPNTKRQPEYGILRFTQEDAMSLRTRIHDVVEREASEGIDTRDLCELIDRLTTILRQLSSDPRAKNNER